MCLLTGTLIKSYSKVHTSVLLPVGVLGRIFDGDNINLLDGVHGCSALSFDMVDGLTSSWTKFPSL